MAAGKWQLFQFPGSRIMFSRIFVLQSEAIMSAACMHVVLYAFSGAVYFQTLNQFHKALALGGGPIEE